MRHDHMTQPRPADAAVASITIGDRYIGSRLPPPNREVTAEKLLPAAQMLDEIATARCAGARVLLLALGPSGGGDLAESSAVYRGLRAFSEAGGTLLVHIRGHI